ncbi:MAG TPA: hypothetical protein VGI40_05745 [Pirellulaceae bacterium]|jgi:hypothetical protein
MTKTILVLLITPVILVVLAFAAVFGTIAYNSHMRVRDATPAFEPLARLGCEFLSQPYGGRHCYYIATFGPNCSLSDSNVAELLSLNKLPSRNELDVEIKTTAVTDASVVELKRITTMDALDVTQSSITDDGIEDLRMALPGCMVVTREMMRKMSGEQK